MGHLSTHVLDTMNGCPAAGMRVTLQRVTSQGVETVKSITLNHDGRNDGGPLLDASTMATGRYRLTFEVAAYFRARGVALPEPAFIDTVPIDFGIADAAGHYHVPLLVSPGPTRPTAVPENRPDRAGNPLSSRVTPDSSVCLFVYTLYTSPRRPVTWGPCKGPTGCDVSSSQSPQW